jgi:multidrug resistance efflux pump
MLRRINLLYVALPLMGWGLWTIFKNISRTTATFYGFAENKETSINLDQDLLVHKIHVKSGQFVAKGTLLLEVSRVDLGFKMNELTGDLAQIEASEAWRVADLRTRMDEVRALKAEKIGNLQASIRVAEAEMALQQRLVRDLKTVQADTTNTNHPAKAKIAALGEEMRLVAEPYDREMASLEKALALSGRSDQTKVDRIKKEVDLFKQEEGRLKIYAPSDGLIGNIMCKEGENISSFNTLIAFYEQHPNTVIGYVHESLSLRITVGDSLHVVSSLHPNERLKGRIVGLGHRIVEIPERLRKIPELRTYGREVMIEIPTQNNFLQKEKVILQWTTEAANPLQNLLSSPSDQ